jgi:hypothetical protein
MEQYMGRKPENKKRKIDKISPVPLDRNKEGFIKRRKFYQ